MSLGGVSKFERWWLDAWPHRLHVRREVPKFLKACPDPFRGEVLEVGSGSGWTSRRILETFPQVELTATDVDPRSEAYFEKLADTYGKRLIFKKADVLSLPFDRSSFDFVVAINVLHHLEELQQAVRQFLRVLRPGGLIGIRDQDPALMRGPLRWLFSTSSLPSRQRLEQLLHDEGCEVVVVSGDIHYYIWARKPYPLTPHR